MSDELTQVARAYRDALAEEAAAKEVLSAAKLRREKAGQAVTDARGPLAEAIVAQARAGARQRDILDAIGNVYTRETVRRICRAAGIEPGE